MKLIIKRSLMIEIVLYSFKNIQLSTNGKNTLSGTQCGKVSLISVCVGGAVDGLLPFIFLTEY